MRRVDLVLRFIYVALTPLLLVVIAKLVSVTGLVLSAAITTGIALAGTAAWRARVGRVPLVGGALGNMARLGEYYAATPPRPLLYYVVYPLLAPYWLVVRGARRELGLYRRTGALVLVISLVGGALDYWRAWYPDIPVSKFFGAMVGVAFIQFIATFSIVMPIVTTVVLYQQRGWRRRIGAMLAIGALIGGGTALLARDIRMVGLETQLRIKARAEAQPARSRRALEDGIGAASAVYAKTRDPAAALAAAQVWLRQLYRADEADAFTLVADGAGQAALQARFGTAPAAVWLVVDRAGPVDDPARWTPRIHQALGR